MARARKVDANQGAIVAALRKIGAKVRSTAGVGNDFPDLCVGYRGRNVLLEVKLPRHEPTQGQRVFLNSWPGEAHVVHSEEEAIAALIGKEAMR